ncbi:MAG: hypothetical protein QM722_01160 [Piscinibacter sp.]
MAGELGQGDWTFRALPDWAKLPEGIVLGDVAGVAVDAKDRAYLFNRGDHPVVVLEADGSFVTSWGHGVFTNAHGAHIGADQAIYLTDNGDHSVRKFSLRRAPPHDHRRAGATRAAHERPALLPLHPHRARPERRHLRLGRLRQCRGPQI